MKKVAAAIVFFVLPHVTQADFADVTTDHPHHAAIVFVQDAGIVDGYGDETFRPDSAINRAEFTKIIIESAFAANEIEACDRTNLAFDDVQINDWFAPYVCVAKANNIIAGYADATFRGATNINYAESAKILSETFALPLGAEGGAWYTQYTGALLLAGANPEKYTASDAVITRGQMAQMIYAILNKNMNCTTFDDFTEGNTNAWRMINDNVMGGRSIGEFAISNGQMTMQGATNTNGGGFSSVRAPLPAGIFAAYDSLKLVAKTDGRGYQITLRDDNRRGISHQATLAFANDDEWQTLIIPFESLNPSFFGRGVEASPFQKDVAQEIGFIANDGLDGDFLLEVQSIALCTSPQR